MKIRAAEIAGTRLTMRMVGLLDPQEGAFPRINSLPLYTAFMFVGHDLVWPVP